MKTENYIIDKYSAMVNGSYTALAGCNNMECQRRSQCLRSDDQLAFKVRFTGALNCKNIIVPVVQEASV